MTATVFDLAALALADDTNLGADITITPGAGGPPWSVRGILSAPPAPGYGPAQARRNAREASIPVQALPAGAMPLRGDILEANAAAWKVEKVERDESGTTWRLILSVAT